MRVLIGKGDVADFHRNPRKVWYTKLQDVSVNGDYEATFELSEPQPSLPVLLASAFSAVYPCHVPQQVMRTKPIGTGPFKFKNYVRGSTFEGERNRRLYREADDYVLRALRAGAKGAIIGRNLWGHGDTTKAARRAVSDAIRHSSLGFFRMLGKTANDMFVDVMIAVPNPDAVDTAAVAKELPYGTVKVTAVAGGLEIPSESGNDPILIANAAVIVSFVIVVLNPGAATETS